MQGRSDMTSVDKKQDWLDVVEVVVAVGSVGTAIAAAVFQQILLASLASLPLSMSVALNLINRKRLLQSDQTAIPALIGQQAQQPTRPEQLISQAAPQAQPQAMSSEQQGAAVAESAQATPFNPNLPQSYLNRALARQRSGEMEAAIADYTEAIRLNSVYAKAYYNRGLAHAHLGNKQDALDDLRAAAKNFLTQGDITNYQKAKELGKQVHELQSRNSQGSQDVSLEVFFS